MESGEEEGQQDSRTVWAWAQARAAEWARKPEQRIWTGSSRRWVENGSHDRLFSGPCRGLPLKDHENDHMSIRVLRALMWHRQAGWTRIRKEEEQQPREQATAEVQGWDDEGLEQDDGQGKSAASWLECEEVGTVGLCPVLRPTGQTQRPHMHLSFDSGEENQCDLVTDPVYR